MLRGMNRQRRTAQAPAGRRRDARHEPRPRAPAGERPPTDPDSRRASRISLGIVLSLVLVLGVILGWREVAGADLGFHLATARWMLEHRSFPATDPFTYTIADHPYVDLQWLFQLLMYGLLQLGGTAAIVQGTTVLTLAFAALLLVRAWRRDGRLARSSIVLLLLFLLGNLWEAWPHLLSWILGSLVLLVLEEHARGTAVAAIGNGTGSGCGCGRRSFVCAPDSVSRSRAATTRRRPIPRCRLRRRDPGCRSRRPAR